MAIRGYDPPSIQDEALVPERLSRLRHIMNHEARTLLYASHERASDFEDTARTDIEGRDCQDTSHCDKSKGGDDDISASLSPTLSEGLQPA